MRQGFSLGAEIVRHLGESGAEELAPDPIDDDPGGGVVLRRDDPVGEIGQVSRAEEARRVPGMMAEPGPLPHRFQSSSCRGENSGPRVVCRSAS